MVLSDDRKGLRPLTVLGTNQAQEKSLNVPQGKRPQNGPAEGGGAHARGFRCRHVSAFACVLPPPLTHSLLLNHARLSVAHVLFEGMFCCLGIDAQ